jgi:hypothetical protein
LAVPFFTWQDIRRDMMFIEDECDGSDDEDDDGGYQSGMDGDVNRVGADESYVDDGGIFVSEGDANATDPTHAGLALRGGGQHTHTRATQSWS